MQHEATTLAYLAGVIDSDGYISVSRSVSKGRYYYAGQIGIAGTRREPHDLAATLWGGAVHCYTPSNTLHRPQFQWARTGRAAAEIIASLMPYLRVKREQAELALVVEQHAEFGRGDDPYPWMPADYDPRPDFERMFLEAKALNCRRPRGKQLILHLAAPIKIRDGRRKEPDMVFVALDGSVYSKREDAPEGSIAMARVGKRAAGRLLDGRKHNEMPERTS